MLSTQKSNEHGRREETYHPDTQEYEGRGRRGMADWEIGCSPYLCGSCLCYQTQRGLEVYNTYQWSLLWGDQRSVAGALLSDSEQRVAEEYCKGLSDKEVARNLCKSFWTIKTQKRSIYRKLGISKDIELIWWMVCNRLGIPFDLKEIRRQGITLIDKNWWSTTKYKRSSGS